MTINIVIKPHRITVKSQDVESIKQTYIIKPKKKKRANIKKKDRKFTLHLDKTLLRIVRGYITRNELEQYILAVL